MSAFSDVRRAAVSARADHRCEYCHLPTRGQVATFPIDHITPRNRGGSNDVSNLALTCPHCNAYKWTATTGTDPETGEAVPLFDPRRERWADHFDWSKTDVGRLAGISPLGTCHDRGVTDERAGHDRTPLVASGVGPVFRASVVAVRVFA